MDPLLEQTSKKVLLLDGAMGTLLYSKGLALKSPPDLLNLENPEEIVKIHESYVQAGSQILLTNTFGASKNRLPSEIRHLVKSLNEAGVLLAQKAAQKKAYVGGCIGPIGSAQKKFSDLTKSEALEIYTEQITTLVSAGVDLLVLETCLSFEEIKVALTVAQKCSKGNIPLLVSMTLNEKETLPSGECPLTIASYLEDKGVDLIGLNCSLGPESLFPIFKQMRDEIKIPISIKPNAGLPLKDPQKGFVYPLSAQEFAEWGLKFIEAGANLIGGCCGTTPATIKELREKIKKYVSSK